MKDLDFRKNKSRPNRFERNHKEHSKKCRERDCWNSIPLHEEREFCTHCDRLYALKEEFKKLVISD